MAQQQNFRSAFNGFNREDVVHYLEFINAKHNNQVNQLTAEAEELRQRIARQPDEDQLAELQAQIQELTDRLSESEEPTGYLPLQDIHGQ